MLTLILVFKSTLILIIILILILMLILSLMLMLVMIIILFCLSSSLLHRTIPFNMTITAPSTPFTFGIFANYNLSFEDYLLLNELIYFLQKTVFNASKIYLYNFLSISIYFLLSGSDELNVKNCTEL